MKNIINWLCFILATTALSPVWAQTYWKGPSGTAANWTDPDNWIGGVVPPGASAITNNGIAEISTGTVSNTLVYVGRTTGPGTLRVSSGGELVGADLTIGYDGKLEAFGGNLLCPSKKLLVGTASGTTGTVVMTGGFLSVTNYSVGDSGVGSFALSNGTITTTEWQTIVGYRTGSDGTFVQSGGTNNYTGGGLYIAFEKNTAGRYILNGGRINLTTTYGIYVGMSGNGYMEMNGGEINMLGQVFVSFYTNSIGMLVMNNFTNTFVNLQIGPQWPHRGGTGTIIQNGGDITITGAGGIAAASNCVSTFIQNGGKQTRKQGMTLPASLGSSGTLIVSNNASFYCTGGLTMNPGGRLKIYDSDMIITNGPLAIASEDGIVEMMGGKLTVKSSFNLPSGTNSGTFYMKGGTFTMQDHNWAYMFYVGGMNADSGPGYFIQTGGIVTNQLGLYLGRNSTNHVGRYAISGGTLASPTQPLQIPKSRVAAFRLKGSAPIVNLQYIAATTNEFLLEYVLDKSPAHLAPITFFAQGYRCGHLRVGFDGGVLLTQTNAFTLIDSPSNIFNTWSGYDYITRPDTNMWTEALAAGNKQSRITLANGYKQADLEIGGTLSASFAEQAMGHVTLANLSTNRLLGLAVRLAVNEKAKTVSALVADLVAAGYTNSVAEVSGVYDIKVVLPPDCVVDKTVKTPSYFAWDFTDVTTSVTNATITAVKIERMLPPPTGTMIRIL